MNFQIFSVFRKNRTFFTIVSKKNQKKLSCLHLRRKTANFWQKEPLPKNPKVCPISRILPLKNRKVLTSVWIEVKILAINGIWTRHLRLPNRGDTRHIHYKRHQQLCRVELYASRAVSGKGKKTPTTELNIFLSKFFL